MFLGSKWYTCSYKTLTSDLKQAFTFAITLLLVVAPLHNKAIQKRGKLKSISDEITQSIFGSPCENTSSERFLFLTKESLFVNLHSQLKNGCYCLAACMQKSNFQASHDVWADMWMPKQLRPDCTNYIFCNIKSSHGFSSRKVPWRKERWNVRALAVKGFSFVSVPYLHLHL